jgi:gamma-glutamyl-gamma-aminobutyrate hydrolase PuuD
MAARAREKCDNGAYAAQPVRAAQAVNKRVLVIYREADRVLPYRDALLAAGLNPVLREANGTLSLSDSAGLVLTGGSDVDPGLYGETRQAETEPPDEGRDALEASLVEEALAQDLPILAICRGLQILNVSQGGTLIQHLDPPNRHERSDVSRELPVHPVTIQPDTLLSAIAGTDTWQVNSRHHQAVRTVAGNLRVSAFDPEDRTVEALEHPDRRFVLAVQWHPEDQARIDPGQLKIFRSFGAAIG